MTVEVKEYDGGGHAPFVLCKVEGAHHFAHVFLSRDELVSLRASIDRLLTETTCGVCAGDGVVEMASGQHWRTCGICGGSGVRARIQDNEKEKGTG